MISDRRIESLNYRRRDSDSALKRNAHAELDFAAGRCGFGDRAELRCVDEAIRSSEIRLIECVECFSANLQPDGLRHRKFPASAV